MQPSTLALWQARLSSTYAVYPSGAHGGQVRAGTYLTGNLKAGEIRVKRKRSLSTVVCSNEVEKDPGRWGRERESESEHLKPVQLHCLYHSLQVMLSSNLWRSLPNLFPSLHFGVAGLLLHSLSGTDIYTQDCYDCDFCTTKYCNQESQILQSN